MEHPVANQPAPPRLAGIRAIVWDWNGTLLDDVGACVDSLATVMTEAGLDPLDREAYRAHFGWPIRDFYRGIGFETDQAFTAAASHYVELFGRAVGGAELQPHALHVLDTLRERGLRQVLISATREELLAAQLAPHQIRDRFEEVLGVTEALDPSKGHVVEEWLRRTGLQPHEVLMVGDTNHDEEIAACLGTRFVRFSQGAQAPAAERASIDDLRQLLDLLPTQVSPASGPEAAGE